MSESITIYGIDFTSSPKNRKPITCVRTRFDGEVLCFEELKLWHDFRSFESFLSSKGPWVAGIDFPFGQSRRFIENIDWPLNWQSYVKVVGAFDRKEFRHALEAYKQDRSIGDKQHKRRCDVLSRSQSPQTLYGTPVGLMFYEGAPRLLMSGVHLPHHLDGDPLRIVIEAYPGFVVRRFIGNRSYKNDSKKKQTEDQAEARREFLKLLCGKKGLELYGFRIDAPQDLARDPSADELDALICAVQAAWGWSNRVHNYGAPKQLDKLEGWISDPAMVTKALAE
jgi:hypothetical protein